VKKPTRRECCKNVLEDGHLVKWGPTPQKKKNKKRDRDRQGRWFNTFLHKASSQAKGLRLPSSYSQRRRVWDLRKLVGPVRIPCPVTAFKTLKGETYSNKRTPGTEAYITYAPKPKKTGWGQNKGWWGWTLRGLRWGRTPS